MIDRRAVIDQSRCSNSPKCIAMKRCLQRAFVKVDGKWFINDNCTACRVCVFYCENQCIEIKKLEEIVLNQGIS